MLLTGDQIITFDEDVEECNIDILKEVLYNWAMKTYRKMREGEWNRLLESLNKFVKTLKNLKRNQSLLQKKIRMRKGNLQAPKSLQKVYAAGERLNSRSK
ncbi:hypothetical protein JTB14_006356 [Gonioctena quinquepunctata]|nr:hypothetical protein JTB14_006356 [Gonioctena quinquepunctata]